MREPNYLIEAFKLKPNLLIAGVGGIVGIAAGSFWLLAGVVAFEAFYLTSMSRHPRFRRAIRARQFHPES